MYCVLGRTHDVGQRVSSERVPDTHELTHPVVAATVEEPF